MRNDVSTVNVGVDNGLIISDENSIVVVGPTVETYPRYIVVVREIHT